MREVKVEDRLRELVPRAGGMIEKLTSPGRRGVPDDLVTWPFCVHFIETKRPGKDAEEHQKRDHARRRKLGQVVLVLNTINRVDAYYATVKYLQAFKPELMCNSLWWQNWQADLA